MRQFRPFRAVTPLLGNLLLATACGGTAQPAPRWPEQPSPVYPGESRVETTPLATTSPAEPPLSSAASLAKEYSDASAESVLEGKATYYSDSLQGHHTANGDVYEPSAFTAAHKKLPFGTIVRVIRADTGATTYAKINDRGPFGPANRIIDLSRAAASELDMLRAGVVDVRVEVLSKPSRH